MGTLGGSSPFGVGVRDVRVPVDEVLFPEFSVEDLVSLPRYHVYLPLMINGVVSRGRLARSPTKGDGATVHGGIH